jgi:hypothetical protein
VRRWLERMQLAAKPEGAFLADDAIAPPMSDAPAPSTAPRIKAILMLQFQLVGVGKHLLVIITALQLVNC